MLGDLGEDLKKRGFALGWILLGSNRLYIRVIAYYYPYVIHRGNSMIGYLNESYLGG